MGKENNKNEMTFVKLNQVKAIITNFMFHIMMENSEGYWKRHWKADSILMKKVLSSRSSLIIFQMDRKVYTQQKKELESKNSTYKSENHENSRNS